MYQPQALHILQLRGDLNETAQTFMSSLLKATDDHSLVTDEIGSASFRSESAEYNKIRGTLSIEFEENATKGIYLGLRSLMRGLGNGEITLLLAEVTDDGKVIDAYELTSKQLQLFPPASIRKKRPSEDISPSGAPTTNLTIIGPIEFGPDINKAAQALYDEQNA